MFLTDLDARAIDEGPDDWLLLAPLKFYLPYKVWAKAQKGINRIIVAPKGFYTDFASIPRLFRSLVTGTKQTRKPATIHDYLRRKNIGSRHWQDLVFMEAMKCTKTGLIKRWVCYIGASIGSIFLPWEDSSYF